MKINGEEVNTKAYLEYLENMKHIRKYDYIESNGDEFTVYEIDGEKCTWFGHVVRRLNAYGRRKFENILVIRDPKTRLIFHYV